jgi:hypothetical protein
MKKLFLSIVSAMLVVGFLSSTAYAGTQFERYRLQQKRIYQGKVRGLLTPREVQHLLKEQQKIQKAYRMALRDRRFTPMERRRIQMLQEKISRNIYRLKRNNQTRVPGNHRVWERGQGKPAGRNIPERGWGHSEHRPYGSSLRSW